MSKPKQLNRGDNCPNCGGELHPAPVPSEKDFARFTDRENPGHLPYGSDTASPDQRAELGELFVCDRCGYKTRFPAESGNGEAQSGDRAHDAARSGGAGPSDRNGESESGESGARGGASSAATRRR